MSASPVACGNCGAPLNVPASVSFATCAHCGSQLRIQRDGGAVYSELRKDVQGVAEAVQRLEGKAERSAAASEQVAREVRIQRLEMQRASTRETIAQLNVRLADKLAELARRGAGGGAMDQLTAGCLLASGVCAGFVAVVAWSISRAAGTPVFAYCAGACAIGLVVFAQWWQAKSRINHPEVHAIRTELWSAQQRLAEVERELRG